MKLVAVGVLNGKKTTVEYTQNQGEEKILFDGKEDSIMECEILIQLDLLHSFDGVHRDRMSADNAYIVFLNYVFDGGCQGVISIDCDTPLKEIPYDKEFIEAGGMY